MSETDSSNSILGESTSSFAGNLLINTRTITRTSIRLRALTETSAKRTGSISVRDLAELLVLLESIVTSDELYYDGTVPESERAKTMEEEGSLEERVGGSNIFSPLAPERDADTVELCRQAAIQAIPLIRRRIDSIRDDVAGKGARLPGVQPIRDAQRLRAFQDSLLAPLPSPDEQAEEARSNLSRNFIGAKCVVGIRLVEAENRFSIDDSPDEDFRIQVRNFVRNRSTDELAVIVPMLVNSFRSNYMNQLGNEFGRAALFAGPDVASAIDQQVLLLSSYVARRLCRGSDIEKATSQLCTEMHSDEQFPFLGMLTLLSAEANDPYSALRVALDDRDVLRARFLASRSPDLRFRHEMTSAQLAEFKQEKLEPIYRKLGRQANWHAGSDALSTRLDRVSTRFLLPAAEFYMRAQPLLRPFGMLLNAMGFRVDTGLIDAAHASGTVAETVRHSSAYASAALAGDEELLRYRTFTQLIERRLRSLLQAPDVQAGVKQRIESVLGCELVDA